MTAEELDFLKWLVASIGAVLSFLVIDWGKLRLEKRKAKHQKEQGLLNAYLEATEASNPDLWLRKLRLIKNFSDDQKILLWASREEVFIREQSALIELYKETVKVTSVLANRNTYDTSDWIEASKRFYQLYWADLPYYGEPQTVIEAMIRFKTHLDDIDKDSGIEQWKVMDIALIQLSETLRTEAHHLENKYNHM